jgi:hypothetical protein
MFSIYHIPHLASSCHPLFLSIYKVRKVMPYSKQNAIYWLFISYTTARDLSKFLC